MKPVKATWLPPCCLPLPISFLPSLSNLFHRGPWSPGGLPRAPTALRQPPPSLSCLPQFSHVFVLVWAWYIGPLAWGLIPSRQILFRANQEISFLHLGCKFTIKLTFIVKECKFVVMHGEIKGLHQQLIIIALFCNFNLRETLVFTEKIINWSLNQFVAEIFSSSSSQKPILWDFLLLPNDCSSRFSHSYDLVTCFKLVSLLFVLTYIKLAFFCLISFWCFFFF